MVGAISIKNVSKTFTDAAGTSVAALQNINLEIKSASFVSLIGASGCGKSTLLRLIAGLLKSDGGSLRMDGAEIEKPGPERGFVFQDHTLFPWLNIAQNIGFGLGELSGEQKKKLVDRWLRIAGLEGFERAYPHQLSGGMCQRASIARALVKSPAVLLLDEPLGALDAFTRMNMQEELLRIWKEHSTTMIMVTHDVDEAIYLSDVVVVLSPRPGRVDTLIPIEMTRPRARSGDDFVIYRKKILDILHLGGEKREQEYYL
jgi:ABC-type nitrate/sulfonate/bicarbonate transport system ATPase subunit